MKRRQARVGAGRPLANAAGQRLLATYASLAERGEHLLGQVLAGQAPRQWAHYPEDDAIDPVSGFQWFYHSHSPEDRPGTQEHGHIHLFARRASWSKRLQSRAEKAFAEMCGWPCSTADTRHLLAIGLDAKGVPISLFTVNSWVTGDLMLSASLSMKLLGTMRLATGYTDVDTVVESVVQLCQPEIGRLLSARDVALDMYTGVNKLEATALEMLSLVPIDWNNKLQV